MNKKIIKELYTARDILIRTYMGIKTPEVQVDIEKAIDAITRVINRK